MSTDSAGWRPDPTGEHQYRYWDGEQWTDRVTDEAVASTTRDPASTHGDAVGQSPPEPMASASLGGAADLPPDSAPSPQPSSTDTSRHSGRIVKKRPSTRLLAAVGAGAAAVIAAVVLLVVGDNGRPADDEPSADSNDPDEDGAGVATETLRDDMRTAAAELEGAETFAFDAVIVVPPPPEASVFADEGLDPLADRFELSGEVSLPTGFVRQQGGLVDGFGFGTEERLTLGDRAWRRTSAFPDVLDEAPWIPQDDVPDAFPPRDDDYTIGSLDNVPDAFDPRFIPTWLAATVEHEDGGTDDGHRVITARVGDDSIPGNDRATTATEARLSDASVEMTVDHSGLPLRVVVTATTNGGEARANYELAATGEPVSIDVPGPGDLDPLPEVQERDIAFAREITAADGTQLSPIGLTAPREGWQFVGAHVTDTSDLAFAGDRTRCPPEIHVSYRKADTWLIITATPSRSRCVFRFSERSPVTASGEEVTIESSPITTGGHDGAIVDLPDVPASDLPEGLSAPADRFFVEFTIEDMFVHVGTDGVPEAELADVLASLDPIDPSEQAEQAGPDDRAGA